MATDEALATADRYRFPNSGSTTDFRRAKGMVWVRAVSQPYSIPIPTATATPIHILNILLLSGPRVTNRDSILTAIAVSGDPKGEADRPGIQLIGFPYPERIEEWNSLKLSENEG